MPAAELVRTSPLHLSASGGKSRGFLEVDPVTRELHCNIVEHDSEDVGQLNSSGHTKTLVVLLDLAVPLDLVAGVRETCDGAKSS